MVTSIPACQHKRVQTCIGMAAFMRPFLSHAHTRRSQQLVLVASFRCTSKHMEVEMSTHSANVYICSHLVFAKYLHARRQPCKYACLHMTRVLTRNDAEQASSNPNMPCTYNHKVHEPNHKCGLMSYCSYLPRHNAARYLRTPVRNSCGYTLASTVSGWQNSRRSLDVPLWMLLQRD